MRLLQRIILALIACGSISAQRPLDQPVAVPRLIRFNGLYQKVNQTAQTGTIGVTFSIYRAQNDGTPLWSEIQNVEPDREGRYTALLGSMQPEGMPVDLFLTREPRWLEVEIDQVKQPRVLLGSVPYALKAGDADTLGGLPASAYLRANVPNTTATESNPTSTASSSMGAAAVSPLANSGTPGCIGVFTNTTDLSCSAMNQGTYLGNPAVSVGGSSYLGAMTLVGNMPGGDTVGMALFNQGAGAGASVSLDMYSTPFNGGIPQFKIKALDDGYYSEHLTFWSKTPGAPINPITEKVRFTSAGNVGIGTANPAEKLEVNGNVMVDGNITLTGNILLPGNNSPIFQSSQQFNSFSAGWGALQNLSSGAFNTAVGVGALGSTTNGGSNSALGASALSANTTGFNNSAFGVAALNYNTTGSGNTALGAQALNQNTTAGNNTAVGFLALEFNTTGTQNTATGVDALQNNTTGNQNSALGTQALQSNTTGITNVAVGYNSLQLNTQGNSNSAFGVQAMLHNVTGGANTAVGFAALGSNTSGGTNTAVGENALSSNTTGGGNVAIGFFAGTNVTTGSNNIDIGNLGSASDSKIIRIGAQGSHLATFIAGIRGATTANNDAVPVVIDSAGQLGTMSSSRRFKKDIQDMGDATADLMRLRPVTFRYRQPFADGSEPIQYGLIAEEVAEVYPELVAHSADGKIETVKYQVLDSMLLNEVQRLHAQNIAQREEAEAQQAQNKAQQERIRALEERLSRLESLLDRAVTQSASR